MRTTRILGAVMLSLFLFAGSASAAYNSGQDQSVSVQLLPGTLTTSSQTGTLTFGLQEAVHSTLTGTTGTSVDHSYIWVNVNGQPVLAVDPLCTPEFD